MRSTIAPKAPVPDSKLFRGKSSGAIYMEVTGTYPGNPKCVCLNSGNGNATVGKLYELGDMHEPWRGSVTLTEE